MGDEQQPQQQQQHVARVLRARNPFEVLELAAREQEEGEVKRAYRRLALLLHPDKNPQEDAKVAFVKIADAYEQLRSPANQRQVLKAGLRRPKPASSKGQGAAVPATRQHQPQQQQQQQPQPGKPRSFMDVLREWEEFERAFFEDEEAARRKREHQTEKKRSQMADRAEREAGERQRLADAVLEEDEEAFQARSSSWASFLKKGKKKRRKGDDGGGGDG